MTRGPRNAMFMSVDIVGSTSFKSRFPSDTEEPGWLKPFQDFFQKVPLRFIGRVAQAFAAQNRIPDSSVWRVRGDEIIFMSPLETPSDAHMLSTAFLDTITDCRSQVLGDWDLEVRGACWAAQLLGRNQSLIIPEMYRGFLDYLGPDVDTGFRLAGCAPPGDVTFSYNLIHLMGTQPEPTDLRFLYSEDRVLKGVVEQLPYPIVMSSSSASKNPDKYTEDARTIVERIESGHPALHILEKTLIRFSH